ncbi:MAG: oligosaccharide flippase family protein [Bacteroides sp.]|nr:oligosaccharide flippase family protein [Bacteroides sp.]
MIISKFRRIKSLCLTNKYMCRIYDSPIGKRLLTGGFWSLSGNIVSKAILLLSTIVVAHILGKNGYGEYSIIRTTIFMFIALASVGVGATTTKYISQYRDSDIQKAYNIYLVSAIFSIVFGVITAIIVIILSQWIAADQLNAPYLSDSIKYGALLLFFCTINGAQSGALAGFENFKEVAKNTCISSLVEIVLISVLAFFYGINGALVGSAGGYIVLTAINYLSIRKHFDGCARTKVSDIRRDEFRTVWVFGVPAALCNLLVICALWMSRTYLVQETNFGEIAIYNAADQVNSIIVFVPSSLGAILLPILTNIKHTDSKGNYNIMLKYNIMSNIGISLMLAIPIICLSKPILHLWGPDFDNTLPLIILSASSIFSSFAMVVGQAIASQGKMWAGFLCNLIWALLVVVISHVFIRRGLGATGLAMAILIAYALHGMYQYVYLRYCLLKPDEMRG